MRRQELNEDTLLALILQKRVQVSPAPFPRACHAQATKTDQEQFSQIRDKYDAPFERALQSFDCAIDFSWKEHFKETPRVGDEGTDEEIEKLIQPIRNRVTLTQQSVTVSSGLTDEAEAKLPHGGMAEGLLKHAMQKSLFTWLGAA